MTVLFADVVGSMDLAAAVGAERLREIMADLVDFCSTAAQRYGGTVDKFTGNGVMPVFGAPAALEDHALRACLAALGIQDEAKALVKLSETLSPLEACLSCHIRPRRLRWEGVHVLSASARQMRESSFAEATCR